MKKIFVTEPSLPDRKKFDAYVDRIFESRRLTNNGPLVNELTQRLEDYLGVRHIIPVANGTLALQIAYKLLGLQGEVITTPFTFIATASSLAWEGLGIRFADIDSKTLNIDLTQIEQTITAKTSALLPVHVFGNPCDVEQIQGIADRHGLKVVYDASHAFGIKYKERSVLEWGDVSTLSFHATKLFHAVEGGALIIREKALADKARKLINFGFTSQESIECLGINAKMNEFQAAMGLALLDNHEENLAQRREITEMYDARLSNLVGRQVWNEFASNNYGYYPVLFGSEEQALKAKNALSEENVFVRRYFYPSLEGLDFLGESKIMLKNTRDVASRILCLPLFPGLGKGDIERVTEVIASVTGI